MGKKKAVDEREVIDLYSQGISIRGVARRLGIARMTAWRIVNGRPARPEGSRVAKKRSAPKPPEIIGDGPIYPDIDESDKDAIIDRLMLENAILRGMQEILKAGSLDQATNKEKSTLIDWLRRETSRPLRELTDFLRISKSSYEYWRGRPAAPGAREALGDDVERVFREDGDCARGYRFVTARLAERLGRPVSEKIVRDVMRARNLQVRYRRRARRYSSYAGELDEAPANALLLAGGTHDFSAGAPNERWVSDITEFRLPDAPKVYLSPVIDLFDGKPVAWRIGLHPDAELANGSLRDACATIRRGQRPLCHTDRGCHYWWAGWKAVCEEFGVARSMSRKGCSPDNAACEGFFGRLKNEFFHGRDWSGVAAGEFIGRLDAYMRFYSEGRLRQFRVDGKLVYDTIDNRRRELGFAV